jgi:hypothetical protein
MAIETPIPPREIAPRTHQAWLQGGEDKRARLQSDFIAWLTAVGETEERFKKFAYDDPEAKDTDFRQHRIGLYQSLWGGESIALEFLDLGGADSEKYVELIDAKLDGLRAVLHAWHGPLTAQADVPAGFKQGCADLDRGNVVDFEKAISEAPSQKTV